MGELIDKIKKFEKFKLIASVFSAGGCVFPLLGFIIFVAALKLLGFIGVEKEVASEEECVPVKSADMICESISVAGHGTMSVDEYVAGVVEHEFAGAPDEVLKAQAIAARSYGLHGATKDGDGKCSVGDTSQAFQTFSPNPSERSKKAAEDTSGMILVDDSGNVVSTEYSSNSLQKALDSFGDTVLMSERDLEVPKSWFTANTTCDTGSLNRIHGHERDNYGRIVYGCGHGRGMGQIAAKYLANEKGYDYKQILEFFYGQDSTYKASIATTGGGDVTEICTGGNLQTLDHYTLNHEGLNILDHTLSASEIADLNSYLENEVKKAGHGSGAAVAAAGQGLIYWLETKKQSYLSYYWAGGHGGFGDDSTVVGGDDDWGSTKFGPDTHNGNHRPYFGMDCSGFVSWATRMGCNPGFGSNVSGGWNNLGTSLSSLSQTEPGDVITNDNHIMLVVKNNGDGSVIIAEETGSKGLVFTQRNSASGYYIRGMKSWYAKNCTDIQPPSNVDSGGGSGSSGSSSNDDLGKQIKSYIESNAAKGDWGVYVKNLKTGKTSTYNSSNSMVSASVIKLFIAGAVYEKVNQHTLSEDTIAGDMRIMIENSNNEAANRLKDAAGGYEAVNNYASSHGYSGVGLHREFSKTGPENMITPRAVGKFLEDVHNGRVVNSTYSNKILGHMRNQKTLHKIPAGLGCSNCSASKSGELPDRGVANDAAIVYSPKATYVIVVLSQTGAYSTAEGNIREISKLVYDYYN